MGAVFSTLAGLGLTIGAALSVGMAFQWINAPAPYLLGSLCGVWGLGVILKPVRRRLGIPRWLHVPVILGLGVLVGAMFNPAILANITQWFPSVAAMLLATVVATLLGFLYLTRIRHYENTLALLCCLPGGQAEIVVLSRELVEKDYVVALCHLVRVSTVFILTPLVLTLVQGQAAVTASNETLAALPGFLDVGGLRVLQFLAVGLFGFLAAKLIYIPMPHLLGPLLLSAVLHTVGVIEVARISEFVMLAQVIIGAAVGARLAQVPIRELAGYLGDALVNAFVVISAYAVTAQLITMVTDIPVLDLVMAFIPGGLYEVTLLALLFGFDVAFITFHHAIRVLIIFFCLTPLVTLVNKGR